MNPDSKLASLVILGLLLAVAPSLPASPQQPAGASQDPSFGPAALAGNARRQGLPVTGPHARGESWAPPDLDHIIPAVSADVPCALPEVLQGASARAKELVSNLEQFTATERIEHMRVNKDGRLGAPQARSYEYLAFLKELSSGGLAVEETRDGSLAADPFDTRLAATGLSALALIFLPRYVTDFEITCEGLSVWRDQPAWQVRFRQRSDRRSRILSFESRHGQYNLKLRGRAWIAAGTHQVVRLEMDLQEPVEPIRLVRHHVIIEYAPVSFHERGIQLWLPQLATLYLDVRGHRYVLRHSFSDFLLFSVGYTQKIQEPPVPPF